ncbi:alpha/beta fold hydrolase [Streptomyces candidus]|uniref:Pimeloyl-ACP methyl ester carboxylesterase n=1 Tax=Streptomyces candidus TaxID=67283 RepID=A0A7X0HGV2_9ACTN|nr:alpha/beta hydrolase [Streptomyces candidus]MBB6437410.1 pimeloyl-ACP methyl ester carboxylesterase [Streptomyces candidus]GHH54040.1 alpha/beta hydrolase [Streptomyces candidus]
MSRPHTFVPPPGTRPLALRTGRGTFAALEAEPVARPATGTALLLPGFTGSKEDFIAMLVPLARAGYRVVAVDGRGQYESEGPRDDQSPYTQGELAHDVLAQAASLSGSGDRGPLHLVGHSLGGQIARAAVLLDPSPFRSLTLVSSGPAEVDSGQQQKVALLAQALTVLPMEEVWDAMQAMEPPVPAPEETATEGRNPQHEEALRRRWLRHSPAQLIATGHQLTTEPDRVAALRDTGLPLHVVSGTVDDTWPVPLLDDMAVRLGAHRTVIKGAGHSPNTDRPDDTARALAEFWDRHPGA